MQVFSLLAIVHIFHVNCVFQEESNMMDKFGEVNLLIFSHLTSET